MADLPECGTDRVEHPVAPARGTTSQRGSAASSHLFVCAGLFLLALSYHLGARSAGAQAPGNPVVAATDLWVYTANGDGYYLVSTSPAIWVYKGNVFSGSTPAQSISIGQLKAKYAPAKDVK